MTEALAYGIVAYGRENNLIQEDLFPEIQTKDMNYLGQEVSHEAAAQAAVILMYRSSLECLQHNSPPSMQKSLKSIAKLIMPRQVATAMTKLLKLTDTVPSYMRGYEGENFIDGIVGAAHLTYVIIAQHQGSIRRIVVEDVVHEYWRAAQWVRDDSREHFISGPIHKMI